MSLHPTVSKVTERIIERSRISRSSYLDLVEAQREAGVHRPTLSCGNLAHGFAASGDDKATIRGGKAMNIGVVTAYNDMLSAHQPYGRYPEQVTQGQDSMELSLFSRDVIAMSTAVALSHGMFEGALLLGICDKIVPGLLMGALRFGHLPTILVPAGPMPSGLANKEKVRVRQLYAEGKVGREELLEAESASYHGAGTCTFFGTANSNQMMMEMMGLHMPGSSFVNPGAKLRQALTQAAVHQLSRNGAAQPEEGNDRYRPLGHCIDEKAIVNAIVGLLATGGSTNHAIHLPAIARSAGIVIDWDDMDELSSVVPLLAQIYPNGSGDVNHFTAAGGMPFVIRELLAAGLAHDDIMTVYGGSLSDGAKQPRIDGDDLHYDNPPEQSADNSMLRGAGDAFQTDGGMRLLKGNLGRATLKVSAVDQSRWTIEAPARVFESQNDVVEAFKAGELDRDVVVVVRFQGPAANGMPELHKLTSPLGVLQDKGFKVAFVTDGRMSGASGKIRAAIHVSPEASKGGPLARLRNGDVVRVCAQTGSLEAVVDGDAWDARADAPMPDPQFGTGRELFAMMRHHCDPAEKGGSAMLHEAGI
jgi:phosphogluconate dehydratase